MTAVVSTTQGYSTLPKRRKCNLRREEEALRWGAPLDSNMLYFRFCHCQLICAVHTKQKSRVNNGFRSHLPNPAYISLLDGEH
eukprot:6487329-Amphidinium_carterae.1